MRNIYLIFDIPGENYCTTELNKGLNFKNILAYFPKYDSFRLTMHLHHMDF